MAGGGTSRDETRADRTQFNAPVAVLVGAHDAVKICDANEHRIHSVAPFEGPALQMIVPPEPDALTADERLVLRGRTNRPGWMVRAFVTPARRRCALPAATPMPTGRPTFWPALPAFCVV